MEDTQTHIPAAPNSASPPDTEWRWLQRETVTHLSPPVPVAVEQTPSKEPDWKHGLVTVVLQAYREHVSLPHLMNQLMHSIQGAGHEVEFIVIDQGMYVNTLEYLRSLEQQVGVRIVSRKGRRGHVPVSDDILAGSRGASLLLWDADLRVDPSIAPLVLESLEKKDLVNASIARPRGLLGLPGMILRSALSLVLLGVPRNGIRAFRRTAWEALRLQTVFHKRWSIDTQLLFHARKLHLATDALEARPLPGSMISRAVHRGQSRLLLRLEVAAIRWLLVGRATLPFLFPPSGVEYTAAGFNNIHDYLFRVDAESAKSHITRETISLAIVTALSVTGILVGISVGLEIHIGRLIMGFIAALYLGIIVIKLFALQKNVKNPFPRYTADDIEKLQPSDLPVITIFVPLYQEVDIIPQIFKRLSDLEYPAEKLDIIFILESTDKETIDAWLAANPPAHFKALLSPDVHPKTKPKALNVAFQKSYGDIIVIFDAEILPNIDQLKRAVLAFKQHPDVSYLHVRIDHYNADYNWITQMFNGEFSFFYEFYFPGLVRMGVPLPMSGHSTYFRRAVIEKVGAWDPYNVAEDCDIGIRLFRRGFQKSLMLDSVSWEQATSTVGTWLSQRTRWMKGFIQTTTVHLRYPLLLKKELGGWKNFAWFLFLVPGSVFLNILNIAQWILFAAWLLTHTKLVQGLYAPLTLEMSVFTFFAGNFLFTYFNLIGLFKRQRYRLMRRNLLSPVYWFLIGFASVRALCEFFVKPFSWNKTSHSTASDQTHSAPSYVQAIH